MHERFAIIKQVFSRARGFVMTLNLVLERFRQLDHMEATHEYEIDKRFHKWTNHKKQAADEAFFDDLPFTPMLPDRVEAPFKKALQPDERMRLHAKVEPAKKTPREGGSGPASRLPSRGGSHAGAPRSLAALRAAMADGHGRGKGSLHNSAGGDDSGGVGAGGSSISSDGAADGFGHESIKNVLSRSKAHFDSQIAEDVQCQVLRMKRINQERSSGNTTMINAPPELWGTTDKYWKARNK